MQKSCFVINLKRAEHHQDLFLKDPKSDFFLVCAEKVFPLHKKFLLRSQYLAAKSEQNQKVYVIQKLNKVQPIHNAALNTRACPQSPLWK